MTRGTFAFIADTNPASETAMQMIVSEEYNGDMGPDMVNGIKFGGEFFWKVETLDQFVKHCLDTAIDFEYADDDTAKDDYRSESMNDYLITGNTKDNPFVMVHVVNRNGIQDYGKNPYSTIFHYSDYVYMKNMSSHPAFSRTPTERSSAWHRRSRRFSASATRLKTRNGNSSAGK